MNRQFRIRTKRGLTEKALDYVWHKLETSWFAVACVYALIAALVIVINYTAVP